MYKAQEDLSLQEKKDLVKVIEEKKNGLSDKDWSEICDEFALDINTETLRKAGVGIKQASDAQMLVEQVTTVNALSDGYVERQKMRDLTRQVNDIYRNESRSELLRETIAEAIGKLPEIKISYAEPASTLAKMGKDRALVLSLGDIHYGAEYKVEGLNGEIINYYNHDVFEERMERLLDETIDIIRKEKISDIHILLVGDLIDGMLRQSQLMRLEYGVVDSTMYFSEYMGSWLIELSKYCNKVHVHAASGNHSEIRPLNSKKRVFEDENMERIIMWYQETRLQRNPRIIIHAQCKQYSKVDILGYSFLLLHGDSEKSIEDLATECIRAYGKSIDFFVCGHKHRENEYPSGMTPNGSSIIIRVPSICGVDKYAISKGYNGKAGAIATVLEKGYGRRCVYPINLQ